MWPSSLIFCYNMALVVVCHMRLCHLFNLGKLPELLGHDVLRDPVEDGCPNLLLGIAGGTLEQHPHSHGQAVGG